jgi:hypothetical protein
MLKVISDSVGFLYDWQTLIAGLIALAGAIITVVALGGQARDERTRKSRAARALLPAALASIDDYAVACIRWLHEASGPARRAEQQPHMIAEINLDPPPRFDSSVAATLRDCVEIVDKAPAKGLAALMSKIQVQSSRIAHLDDYLRRYQCLDVKLVGLERNIDEFTANAVEIAASANSFFAFARLETNKTPAALDFEALSGAFHACGLDPIRDVDAWNVLTKRFLPPIPKGQTDEFAGMGRDA